MLNKQPLRRGYTTGACATAAALASLKCMLGERCEPGMVMTVNSPQGIPLSLSLYRVVKQEDGYCCSVIKDAGDDPDVTHGMEIQALVTLTKEPGITYQAGEGVGRITKPGLKLPVGEVAINPGPRQMMSLTLSPLLPHGMGCCVSLSIPNGCEVAKKTFNPRLGIEGGLSIIGTTGRVEPMSDQAFIDTIRLTLQQAKVYHAESVVLVYGNQSERLAQEKLDASCGRLVVCSNFVGEALKECIRLGIRNVVLVGPLGKLIKVAAGIFQTHSHVADARQALILANLVMLQAADVQPTDFLGVNTTDEVLRRLPPLRAQQFSRQVAQDVCRAIAQYEGGQLQARCLLTDGAGRLLVDTDTLE